MTDDEMEEVKRRNCEACGLVRGARVKVRVTNGALYLCQQCLDDINRKNPEVRQLRQERERLRTVAEKTEGLLAAIHWWREGGMTADGCRQAEKDTRAALAALVTPGEPT